MRSLTQTAEREQDGGVPASFTQRNPDALIVRLRVNPEEGWEVAP
jgi:hypothetical protein